MRLIPSSLVIHRLCPLASEQELVPITAGSPSGVTHLARQETVTAFESMRTAALHAKVGLTVIWAYRNPQLQAAQFREAKIKHGTRKGILWLAPPGFSEHQTGWVLDIGDADDPAADDNPFFVRTAAFQWLQAHAHRFGFELSFPPGNWQGVSYEPWHWRYIGTPEARAAFHPTGWRFIFVWGRSWLEALRQVVIG